MGCKNNRVNSCSNGWAAQGRGSGHRQVLWLIALSVVLLASAGPARGQFTVQPMKVDLQVRPGKLVKSVINVTSLDPAEMHTIDLTLVDLTQNEDTQWEIIEPNSGFDLSTISSCKAGLRLSPTAITLAPMATQPVELTLAIPRGTKGFSCAGILATLRNREGNINPYLLRFLVPVTLEIQGNPGRHNIQPTDLTMEFRPATEGREATTILGMRVENNGATFGRCRPVSRIWSWDAGHWHNITTTAFQDNTRDVGIIPGAKINIQTDLMKALPAGKYKIAGVLYVDGIRRPRVEKIIDFAGDPSVTSVAADTPLDLIPNEVTIEGVPGGTRRETIKVYNGSDETVAIQATLAPPPDFVSKVMNNVKGADLDCSEWVKIEPERFNLSGEADSQTVRIVTSMPESAGIHPFYYTNLNFWAFYPDGRRAGLTTANIYVRSEKVAAQPSASVAKFTPRYVSGSEYQIVAQFSNNGIVHFEPKRCRAAVNMGAETVPRASVMLRSSLPGPMLPGEERTFSGILDFSTLDPGPYRLSAAIEYAPDTWKTKQMAIQVSVPDGRIDGGQRVIQVTGIQEELPDILEVKW